MSRLTSLLESAMAKSPITPIIVETNNLRKLREEVIPFLPVTPANSLRNLFPRLPIATDEVASLREISTFNMLSFVASQLLIEQLAQNPLVNTIYLDRIFQPTQTVPANARFYDSLTKKVFTSTFWTRKFIGADIANSKGYSGKNVSVGIIDTGGTKLHQQTTQMQMRTAIPGLYTDANGHGQHVASTACGKLARDPLLQVDCEGMAPDASLISIKALGFVLGFGRDSDLLKALEISLQLKCDIVNLSVGSTEVTQQAVDDPLSTAISKLTSAGTMVVTSAGNAGPNPQTITSPGALPDAITVGAWDELAGTIAKFSSRGPAYNQIKPDIMAPGIEVHSSLIGILDLQSDMREQRYGYLSGTSMAAPHVTGLLACAKQMFKERGLALDTNTVKTILAAEGQTKNNDTGWGLINWSMFENYLAK